MKKREKIAVRTISLPADIARRAERIALKEGRSVSELFRESFRLYEREYQGMPAARATINWAVIRRSLKRIGSAGRKINLSAFVARDRYTH